MSSKLSQWLNKTLGLPIVRIPGIDETIAGLAEQVARGNVSKLVKKLPDAIFYSMLTAFKLEAIRRSQEL